MPDINTGRDQSDHCGFVTTYTGRKVSFPIPSPAEIEIEDIARGLSAQARYNGHTAYKGEHVVLTTAQHSVMVYDLYKRRYGDEGSLWALLHDGHEAFLGDMVGPMKPYFPQIKEWEHDFDSAIIERFDVPYNKLIAQKVKTCDNIMLFAEASTLSPGFGLWTGVPENFQWIEDLYEEQYAARFQIWNNHRAYDNFIFSFKEAVKNENSYRGRGN